VKSITISKKGTRSEFNEDAMLALPNKGVFLVSDGVGGGPSGHEASRSTVQSLYDALSVSNISEKIIVDGISFANKAVLEKSKVGDNKGMACTLVLAWIEGDILTCFNIGDSRIYRVRQGEIQQLTTDHVKQVERNNRVKSLVTNAIGIRETVTPEITQFDWLEGDIVVLMSDGISDVVSDTEMCELLSKVDISMLDRATALIDASIANGSEDDKTLVIAF